MPSITEVDNIHEKTTDAGVTIGHDLKLSSGNAIKNASGVALLTEGGALGSSVVFPAGHVIQMNSTTNDVLITRTGDQSSYASTGITCVLPNDLQSSSKLFAQFNTQVGEAAGSWWALFTIFAIYNNSINAAAPRGLGCASHPFSTNQTYSNQSVSGSILFTPSGTGAARRTVDLNWKFSTDDSHISYLNRSESTAVGYDFGSTTLTLMEIAQ